MSDEPLISLKASRILAQIDRASGDWRRVDGGEPGFAAGRDCFRLESGPFGQPPHVFGSGVEADSTVLLHLPYPDVDSEGTWRGALEYFYLKDAPHVAVLSGDDVPDPLLHEIVQEVAEDVRYAVMQPETMEELAVRSRWIVVEMLRRRIRAVEASVRIALADDHVSATDYEALREYPNRLALVERVVRALDEPQWSGRPASQFLIKPAIIDRLPDELANVGDDARAAVARLSGLISSQSVVIAQRQAAQTARLQRVLTLVGTTVLVPGLVAAVFGANVDFPGEGTERGFTGMLLLMTALALLSYAALRSAENGMWAGVAKAFRFDKLSERWRLAMVSVAAIAAAIAGVTALWCA
jgi:hypothetical protein